MLKAVTQLNVYRKTVIKANKLPFYRNVNIHYARLARGWYFNSYWQRNLAEIINCSSLLLEEKVILFQRPNNELGANAKILPFLEISIKTRLEAGTSTTIC